MLLHCSPQPAGWRRRSGRMAGFIPLQVQLWRPWIQKPLQLLGEVTKCPTCSGFYAFPAAPRVASPLLPPSDVQMNISNYGEVKSSSNVMGVIRGSVEPGEAETPTRVWRQPSHFPSADRYVIYGNHRDSWVHGAIDPSSGTSVMLELSRVLGMKVKQGELWGQRKPNAYSRCGV